jgi:ElaB/YqjD/DUF883 family membrane-anchored ribosome-binding protein
MKQNSERTPEHAAGRVPHLVVEGRKLIRRSARKAGESATRVARKGSRLVGRTIDRTERYARRKPWMGIGAAACTGAFIGALATFFFFRD